MNRKEEKKIEFMWYNEKKTHNGRVYTGMKIGNEHTWRYENGIWNEKKTDINKWEMEFRCKKTREHLLNTEGGAQIGSKYHWLILADQFAEKLDGNSYQTQMRGIKLKVGHKRPYWRMFSNEYENNKENENTLFEISEWVNNYKDKLIRV